MASTITDIAELVCYHLVLAEPDDERADANLAQLVQQLEQMASRPLWREASWDFCDRCGWAWSCRKGKIPARNHGRGAFVAEGAEGRGAEGEETAGGGRQTEPGRGEGV